MLMAKRGRRRNAGAIRDRAGRARGEPAEAVMAVGIAQRLKAGVAKADAHSQLAGFTLGRMRLCGIAAERSGLADYRALSAEQYEAGEAWSRIVRRHASVMGYELTGTPKSPSFVMVGSGLSCGEPPDEREIAHARNRFALTYDALMRACREHGIAVRNIVYAVCIENRPLDLLTEDDCGRLRIGLNALARVLR